MKMPFTVAAWAQAEGISRQAAHKRLRTIVRSNPGVRTDPEAAVLAWIGARDDRKVSRAAASIDIAFSRAELAVAAVHLALVAVEGTKQSEVKEQLSMALIVVQTVASAIARRRDAPGPLATQDEIELDPVTPAHLAEELGRSQGVQGTSASWCVRRVAP